MRSSPANGCSRPPEKKNVTCAYFSVSAIRSCRFAELRQVLTEGVDRRLRLESARCVDIVRVARQHDEIRQSGCPPARKAPELRVDEGARELAGPVGAKVHEHDDVAVANPRGRFTRPADQRGLDEFVGLAPFVRRFQRRGGVVEPVFRRAARQHLEGGCHALPAIVPVHCVVAAAKRSHAPVEPGPSLPPRSSGAYRGRPGKRADGL